MRRLGVLRVRTQTLTIRADGRNDPDHWVNHPDGPTLAYLQEAVGGLIERVPLGPYWTKGWVNLTMWAHEEALMTPFPVLNHRATRMAGVPIYGDVVLSREVSA